MKILFLCGTENQIMCKSGETFCRALVVYMWGVLLGFLFQYVEWTSLAELWKDWGRSGFSLVGALTSESERSVRVAQPDDSVVLFFFRLVCQSWVRVCLAHMYSTARHWYWELLCFFCCTLSKPTLLGSLLVIRVTEKEALLIHTTFRGGRDDRWTRCGVCAQV